MGLKYSFWVLAFLLVGQVSGADRAKNFTTKRKKHPFSLQKTLQPEKSINSRWIR